MDSFPTVVSVSLLGQRCIWFGLWTSLLRRFCTSGHCSKWNLTAGMFWCVWFWLCFQTLSSRWVQERNTCSLCFQQVRHIDVTARTEQEHLRTSGGARFLVDTEQWRVVERHAGLHGRQFQVKALDRRLRARCCVDHHPERMVQLRRQTWKWILPHNNVVCVTLVLRRRSAVTVLSKFFIR